MRSAGEFLPMSNEQRDHRIRRLMDEVSNLHTMNVELSRLLREFGRGVQMVHKEVAGLRRRIDEGGGDND